MNSDWLASSHGFERVSKTTLYSNHIKNYEIETRKVFERENIQTENIPLTRQTDFVTPLHDDPQTGSTEISKNGHKSDEPYSMVNQEPEPSSSDSSSKTSSSESRSRKNKRDKNKKRCKHWKDDLSEPSSSNDSASSDASDYRRKRRNKKSHQNNDPIKLCASLTAKILTTSYKSKIIRFKMDEDLPQRRIYFLTFVESLDMIFLQYTETCELLLDYPKIGGENDIEDYAKKAIGNLLHENIDVHSRRFIADFPQDGIKCIEKLQSHCANMTFSDKSRYDRTFQKVTHKGE